MVSVRGNQPNNKVTASSSTSTNNRAEVKPVNINNQVEATNNLAKYYSEISQDWAVGEGLIQNIDYSSKTYALQAKESANEAKESMEITQGYMDNAISNIQTAETTALNNIVMQEESALSTVNQGVDQLNTTITEGVETIETTKTEASEYVETTANESIAEVNQAKEQAIKDFNKASDKVNYLFVMPIGTIGFSPFPIDETKGLRRILNGQIIIQEQFTGFVKWLKDNIELYPQMACTEEEWQATVTMSVYGQCGKFVIDDEAGTIRLPKITGFIQGLTDLASLGELVEGRLPAITTKTTTTTSVKVTVPNTGWTVTGTSLGTATKGTLLAGSGSGEKGETLESINATSATRAATVTQGATSTSTSTYNDNKVQPESVRYPYFIQVATGVEETIDTTREIELNNPFFFGYYQYFETAPNNISWLKSQGQWNSKAVYTDYYNWILTNANNGVENFKLSTDTYDDYAWVVNTADETFRLPLKTKNAPFTVTGADTTLSIGAVSIKGNGQALGLSNINRTSTGSLKITTASGTDIKELGGTMSANCNGGDYIGVNKDASKSGLTGSVSGTATTTVSTSENTNVSLYFYVGETTQNANLVNVGRIEESLAKKLDISTVRYDSSTSTLFIGVL